jgi:hypothetical protein
MRNINRRTKSSKHLTKPKQVSLLRCAGCAAMLTSGLVAASCGPSPNLPGAEPITKTVPTAQISQRVAVPDTGSR